MKKNIEVKTRYVAPNTGYFEIDNGNAVYRLMEKMTNSMTQDKLAEFYETEKKEGNPLPMNSVQHYELFNDAVKSGNADLLNFIQKGLKKYTNTLTRVIYNPIGEQDETIHNYGTSDTYSVIGDIVGDDNWIKSINNKNALDSLLKTKDVKRINKISNAINNTPMYLWRFNSKPSEKTECVVGFNANVVGLGFIANRYSSGENPAFLVEKIK
jgi:hypothetical protein